MVQTRDALNTLTDTQPVSTLIEEMFDRIIAKDILSSQGVGTDNMTCIVVQLKRGAM